MHMNHRHVEVHHNQFEPMKPKMSPAKLSTFVEENTQRMVQQVKRPSPLLINKKIADRKLSIFKK